MLVLVGRKMNKKTWVIILIIVVIIALIIFLYPKKCGSWSTAPYTINKECSCFGIKSYCKFGIMCSTGAGGYWCHGICNQNICECREFNISRDPVMMPIECP